VNPKDGRKPVEENPGGSEEAAGIVPRGRTRPAGTPDNGLR